MDYYAKLLADRARARENTFHNLGKVSEKVLSRTMPIRTTGGGAEVFMWPAQAIGKLRIIDCGDSVIVTTDGISDPWDRDLQQQPPPYDFAFEAAVEVPKRRLPDSSDEGIASSWVPTLLWAATDWMVAERFDLKSRLKHFGCMTLAVPPVPELESFVGQNGFMGALFGIPYVGDTLRAQLILSMDDTVNANDIWFLPFKILTPDEYEWAMSVPDASNTMTLAEAFIQRGDRHLTWIERPSILPDVPQARQRQV